MEIASENALSDEIETTKKCAPTQVGFVRFQAIELLLDGYEKDEVARIHHCTTRTIERKDLGQERLSTKSALSRRSH